MDECPSSAGIFARIACILSYGGSLLDCWINYFLLLTSVTCWILYVNQFDFLRSSPCYRSLDESSYPRPTHAASIGALVFLTVFQIGLCLLLQCSGISIIWCGISGWMFTEGVYHRRRFGMLLIAPLLCNVGGMIYYAITAEAITTVAHICAVLLGSLLYVVAYRLAPNSKSEAPVEPSSESR